jgi:hypothetical protein
METNLLVKKIKKYYKKNLFKWKTHHNNWKEIIFIKNKDREEDQKNGAKMNNFSYF